MKDRPEHLQALMIAFDLLAIHERISEAVAAYDEFETRRIERGPYGKPYGIGPSLARCIDDIHEFALVHGIDLTLDLEDR